MRVQAQPRVLRSARQRGAASAGADAALDTAARADHRGRKARRRPQYGAAVRTSALRDVGIRLSDGEPVSGAGLAGAVLGVGRQGGVGTVSQLELWRRGPAGPTRGP